MLFHTSSPKAMVISYHDELENTHVLHFDQARVGHIWRVCWFLYKVKIILILRIQRKKLGYAWIVCNLYNMFHKIIIQYMLHLGFFINSACWHVFMKYRFNHYIVTLSSDEFSMILLKIFACPTLDIVIDRNPIHH